MPPEDVDHLRDRGVLLADGHVDADDVLALLIDDRVEGDGGLAGLAVADDQLALPAADGNHRVDALETGLQGLADGLPLGDARGVGFQQADGLGRNRGAAVQRLAQRRDNPAEHLVADGHGHQPPGRAHVGAFADLRVVAVDDGRQGVLLQVEDLADDVILEQEHLAGHRPFQAVDAGDAVAHLHDPSHLDDVELGLVLADLLFRESR